MAWQADANCRMLDAGEQPSPSLKSRRLHTKHTAILRCGYRILKYAEFLGVCCTHAR